MNVSIHPTPWKFDRDHDALFDAQGVPIVYFIHDVERTRAEADSIGNQIASIVNSADVDRSMIDSYRRTFQAMMKREKAVQEQIDGMRTMIANLRSALEGAGHDPDCPQVHGASADCVPGTCKRYRGPA